MTQGHGDDLFGRGISGADGADPGAEITPDELGVKDGKDLEKPLGDDAGLKVAMATISA